MNELHLSKRLETVVQFIPKDARLADIGSDHAYLPCYAYIRGYITTAIAGEITEGPLRSAKEQVRKTGLEHVISVRKGDGLEVIQPNEVDCITIAGMGGTLIKNILDRGKEKLVGVKRLILQPNVGAHVVREWLLEHDWELIAERIIEEDGRIYEILVAEKGEGKRPYDSLEAGLLLGPFLMKERSSIFTKKWQLEMNQWKKILKQLEENATTVEAKEKKRELERRINIVKEVLK